MIQAKTRIPKYTRLASLLRKQIAQGELGKGEQLDPIAALADAHKTTKATVSKALEQLEEEGLLDRIQGRGTFIKDVPLTTIAMVFDLQIFDSSVALYYTMVLRELEHYYAEKGWKRKVFINVSCESTAGEFLKELKARSFQAMILCSRWVADNKLEEIAKAGIYCVGMYSYSDLKHWVSFDSYQTGLKGVQALTGLGCKRIAIIQLARNDFPKMPRAEAGYRIGLLEAGQTYEPIMEFPPVVKEQEGYDAFCRLWDRSDRPDGIIITDENLTKGVVRAIIDKDLKTPRDVILASQVPEGQGIPFVIPIVELRVSIRNQVLVMAQMVDKLISQQTIPDPQILLSPTVYNPFEKAK